MMQKRLSKSFGLQGVAIVTILVAVLTGCATRHPREFEGARVISPTSGVSPRADAIAHYLAAVVYQRSGRFEDAARELQAASDLLPSDFDLALATTQGYMLLKNDDKAVAACQRAVAARPNDLAIVMMLGWLCRQAGRYDEAEAAFRSVIEMDTSGSPLGYQELALLEEHANDLVSAVEIYEQLLKKYPDVAALHLRLGLNLARMNDAKAARAELERALELDPSEVAARHILGLLCLDLDDYPAAEKHLRTFLETEPGHIEARESFAGALARQGDWAGALAQIDRILADPGATPKHNLDRTCLLLRLGREAEAVEATPPKAAPLVGYVLKAIAQRRSGVPCAETVQALDGIESDVDAETRGFLLHLVRVFGNDMGRFLTDELRALHTEAPRSRVLEVFAARLLLALDENDEAEKVLRAALETWPNDKWFHVYLANLYSEQKRSAEAEAHGKAALAADPNDPDSMNFLGYLYADENRNLDEAEALLNKAVELDPANGYYLDSLGWVYYRRGNAKKAIELIRKAIISMDSDDAELRNHLGDAYLLNGDATKAVAEWRRARRLDPELAGVQEKIDAHGDVQHRDKERKTGP